jgi:Flp pilus assembly protein TadD
MNEFTPPAGLRSVDENQLPLGGFDGAPLLPLADSERAEGSEGEQAVVVREPPVCGEWSFDISDDADGRTPAKLIAPAPSQAPWPPVPSRASVTPAAREPAREPVREYAPRISPRAVAPPLRSPAAVRSLTPPTPLPALAELKSIHDANPGDARTAIQLATALDKRGNIEGALSVLGRAIEAGADGVPLRCARATILSGRLRYDDAEAELKRAAKLQPEDPDVLLQQGILACRRAKWRDAVEPLTMVARMNPVSAQAHFYLGESLNKLDRLQEALVSYERAAELEPANWRALKGVGIMLDRIGRPADAAAFYRRARDAQSG